MLLALGVVATNQRLYRPSISIGAKRTASCAFQCSKKRLQFVFPDSLQAPTWIVRRPKSLRHETTFSRRNSLDISKAETQSGMSEFDPSQGSQPVRVRPGFPRNARMGRKSRLFAHSTFVSDSRFADLEDGNRRKSPASSAKFPFCGDYRRRPVRSRLPAGAASALIRFRAKPYQLVAG